jgi:hypothetical protein
VAGAWFDTERGKWRVSTVPVRGFETEREAVAFYHSNCDPLTGMLSMRHRALLDVACRRNIVSVDTASGIGVFPADRLGVR